jgi:hypothetical protein
MSWMLQLRGHDLHLELISSTRLPLLTTPAPALMFLPEPGGSTRTIFDIQWPLLSNGLYLIIPADWTIILTRVRAKVHLLVGGAQVLAHSTTPRQVGDQWLLTLGAVEEGSSILSCAHFGLVHVTGGAPGASLHISWKACPWWCASHALLCC